LPGGSKRISIVVAAHDEGANVRRTVESVLGETAGPAFEIVLVDDGSSDGSFAFLEEAPFRGDGRLRVCRMPEWAGCIAARREGALAAQGDALLFLDAHMAVTAGWLEKLDAALERWGPYAAVVPRIATLDEDRWAPNQPNGQVMAVNERFDLVWRGPDHPAGLLSTAGGCCVLMPASFFRQCGGFDTGLRRWGCEFVDLVMKVYAAGGVCCQEPGAVVGHLFRSRFPYPMNCRDVAYNKLRTAFIHLPDASFRRFLELTDGAPGFPEAIEDLWGELPSLDEKRQAMRAFSRRHPEWFVRTFLPELCDRQEKETPRPMSTFIDRAAMERLARVLVAARQSSAISDDEFKRLHARFRAQDAQGNVWTVGIRTLAWHRLVFNQWTPGQPVGPLRLAGDILDDLRRLSISPAACTHCGAPSTPEDAFCVNCGKPARPAAAPGPACRACGAALVPGNRFCTGCGAPASAEALCPNCRQPSRPGTRFCNSCGAAM
jgi:GT2 family glycosyltransferase